MINNVVKKMDVKPRFHDAFRKDGFQTTFQFKQKVCTARWSCAMQFCMCLSLLFPFPVMRCCQLCRADCAGNAQGGA